MGVEQEAEKLNFRNVVATAVMSALGFMIALFWRDAITSTINRIIPEGEGLTYQYSVAILVTLIAVVAIYIISKYLKVASKEKK